MTIGEIRTETGTIEIESHRDIKKLRIIISFNGDEMGEVDLNLNEAIELSAILEAWIESNE